MTGLFITGTRDPNRALLSNPELVLTCLVAYWRKRYWQQVEIFNAPADLATVDWAELWQSYTTLQQSAQVVAVAYSGSLGDSIGYQLTVADWVYDWRVPLLLTLPLEPWSLSQATAFSSLAERAHADLRGFILVQDSELTSATVDDIAMAIATTTAIPVLGVMPLAKMLANDDAAEKTELGSLLDWQMLEFLRSEETSVTPVS